MSVRQQITVDLAGRHTLTPPAEAGSFGRSRFLEQQPRSRTVPVGDFHILCSISRHQFGLGRVCSNAGALEPMDGRERHPCRVCQVTD